MKKMCIVSILLAIFLAGCKEEVKKVEAVRPVRVITIDRSVDGESRSFPGKVKATRDASLAFRVSGQIIKLDVKEGDYVKKGQLIAMLDQRDFQASVADLQARLAGARSVLKEAKLNIERNRKLLKDKIIAQSAFDTAESNYESSRAEVLSLEQSLRKARLNLQYTRLEAPFSGFIAEKIPSNHEYVQAKEPIVQLADTSALDIVVDIPETVLIKAKSHDGALDDIRCSFATIPGKEFPLRLKEYQTTANPGTQTYEVTMTMDNPEGLGIQPGMTAEVHGNLGGRERTEKTVSVPFSSVVGEVNGPKYVWVLNDDNTVAKREVEVQAIISDMFNVSEGIVPGDVIVMAGANYLREGQKVKILEGRIGSRD